ncbi:WD40 repeat-like protein, partial [Polychaeton citri CBS 116435]
PPASPTKRNGRHASDASRSKKFRLFSDRKDTPAPGPSHGPSHSRRPLSRSTFSGPVISSGGGEGARRAAANSNNRLYSSMTAAPQSPDDDLPVEESLYRHRARLGSLNSAAADSGADLSTYSGASSVDCGTDMEIDSVMEEPETKTETPVDFTISKLPSELCVEIFRHLDAGDLRNAMFMNKRWHSLATDRLVWRSTYLRKYDHEVFTDPPPIQVGGFGVGRPNRPNQEWQRMYKARLQLDANWKKGAKDAGKAVYLSGHTDSVYCLQFDEEKIITGSRDRTIRVWDINTFQCLRVIGGPNVRPALGPRVLRTVDYPSFHMATASVNGTNYGNSIYHTPWTYHDASILCLQYDDKILVTGSSDSDLLVWDVKTFEPIRRLTKHSGGVLDVALDAKHIVSCSKDSRIIVWDRETYEPKAVLSGHRGPVNAVQLRGNLLVSASGDGIARLWDLSTMKLTKEFSAKERGLAAVEFSEDMKYVLAGGNDHITYKFETETGKEVTQFVGHTQLVRSLWLDSANKRVVSGSYDLDLRVYDFETGQEIWRAEEWTTSWMLAAKSDYRRIVAASQDGRILIVDFGINRGGKDDGELIKDINMLRGLDKTNEVEWRPIPW